MQKFKSTILHLRCHVQFKRHSQETLTGKEQRDVIECRVFNTDELQELAVHLMAYANRIQKEEMDREDWVKHYESKENRRKRI